MIAAPGALERFKAAAALYGTNAALARKVADKAFDRLDADPTARLADTYIARELAADDNATWRELVDRGYARRASHEEDWRECRAMLDDDDREGLTAYWRDWAPAYAASPGYVIDTTGTPFARLSHALAKAARYAVGVSTKQAARTALRLFREAHGSLAPAALTRLAVTEFLDLLSQRPALLPPKSAGWRCATLRPVTVIVPTSPTVAKDACAAQGSTRRPMAQRAD